MLSKIKLILFATGAGIIGVFYFMIGALKRENQKLEQELSSSDAENELLKENAKTIKSVYSNNPIDLIKRMWERNKDKIQK